jgi:hypothetical protein
MVMDKIAIWKKNGLRLRVLGMTKGRQDELRVLVQKETADGMHGVFSVRPEELNWKAGE